MDNYKLIVNGEPREISADPEMPLLWVLRDLLSLKGTKYGCGIAQCGACTVHVDGVGTRSCTLPVRAVGERRITTIEGLGKSGLNHLQQHWDRLNVPQCGYCQPGQLMTATHFIAKNPQPSQTEIQDAMKGNLCRCGTYSRIIEAIKQSAEASGRDQERAG